MLFRSDDAIADAVSEFGRLEEIDTIAANAKRATQDLRFLAHELRNLFGTAALACEALRDGSVGASCSTSAVLERSLEGMRDLVDRSLSIVRLDAGVLLRERILIRELIQEIEISAVVEVKHVAINSRFRSTTAPLRSSGLTDPCICGLEPAPARMQVHAFAQPRYSPHRRDQRPGPDRDRGRMRRAGAMRCRNRVHVVQGGWRPERHRTRARDLSTRSPDARVRSSSPTAADRPEEFVARGRVELPTKGL